MMKGDSGGINFTPLTFKLLKRYYSWQQAYICETKSVEGAKKEIMGSTVLYALYWPTI